MHTALGITAYSLDLDPAPACFTHVDTVSTGHFVVQAYGKSAIKTAMASQTWLFSQQDQLEPSREKTRARLTVIQLSETDVGKALCVYEFKWQSGNPLLTSAWKPWCSGGERVGNKANRSRDLGISGPVVPSSRLTPWCSPGVPYPSCNLARMFPLPRLSWSPGLVICEQHLMGVSMSQS